MTFKVSLLFQADARAAKAEVESLATSARKVGDAAQDMGRKPADAARGVSGLSARPTAPRRSCAAWPRHRTRRPHRR